MYINGQKVATHKAIGAGQTKSVGVGGAQIARKKTSANFTTSAGLIFDDYAIFPSALTTSDIQTYMNDMTTDPNIVEHYYNFDGGSLSDIVGDGTDASGEGGRHTDTPHN